MATVLKVELDVDSAAAVAFETDPEEEPAAD